VGFLIKLGSAVNLVGATVTARVHVASSSKPHLQLCIADTASEDSHICLGATAQPGWFEIAMRDIAPYAAADSVNQIGVVLTAFPEPNAVLYLDSITISPNRAGPWNFASSGSPLVFEPGFGDDVTGSVSWMGGG
jgi:hypothetical protein